MNRNILLILINKLQIEKMLNNLMANNINTINVINKDIMIKIIENINLIEYFI